MIKQKALPGTGEKGEGNHDSGRIKHIFVVSDFWDKGVPAFLSKVRNINLICKGSCRQWKSSSMAGDLQMYIHTHMVKAVKHPPTRTPVPALVVSDPRGARGSVWPSHSPHSCQEHV